MWVPSLTKILEVSGSSQSSGVILRLKSQPSGGWEDALPEAELSMGRNEPGSGDPTTLTGPLKTQMPQPRCDSSAYTLASPAFDFSEQSLET